MKTQLLTAAFVAALAATSAYADKVTLKSGSVLTGTAGVLADGKLKFAADDGLGDVLIPIENVVKLEAANNDHVLQYNDNSKETKKVSVDDGALVVDKDGEMVALDMGTVKAVDPEEEKWKGSINLSGMATRGNTVSESASVAADASRRWEKDRFTSNFGYYYAASGDSKQNKQKTVSRLELQAQEDHFWNGQSFYSYVNGKYEFDRIMNLEYRYRLGLGIGYQWFENKDFGLGKTSFNQELGMSYIAEKYDHTDDDNFGTFRYAHHFAWEVASVAGLAFVHNFEYLPQVDDWSGNYLLDTDVGLTYAFRANWQLIAKAEWDYKRKVAEGTKHSDIRYILGLGYKW